MSNGLRDLADDLKVDRGWVTTLRKCFYAKRDRDSATRMSPQRANDIYEALDLGIGITDACMDAYHAMDAETFIGKGLILAQKKGVKPPADLGAAQLRSVSTKIETFSHSLDQVSPKDCKQQ